MTSAPYSALNLRLTLAAFGTIVSLVVGVLTLRAFGVGPALFLFTLAAIGVVDLVVVQRKRRQRTAEHTNKDHTHDSPFE